MTDNKLIRSDLKRSSKKLESITTTWQYNHSFFHPECQTCFRIELSIQNQTRLALLQLWLTTPPIGAPLMLQIIIMAWVNYLSNHATLHVSASCRNVSYFSRRIRIWLNGLSELERHTKSPRFHLKSWFEADADNQKATSIPVKKEKENLIISHLSFIPRTTIKVRLS